MVTIVTSGLLDRALNEMVNNNGADLYLSVNNKAQYRVGDTFYAITEQALTSQEIDDILSQLLNDSQKSEFASDLELNMAIEWRDSLRFRINCFHQQHYRGIVIRRIKTTIPTLAELKLPHIYTELSLKNKGLVILSSPSGSGKSTSVAAMLAHRNNTMHSHIMTVEDPIEYIHKPNKCIFTQREVGIDTYSYAMALKNALRQSVDVIFIGEIRDRDTMEQALNFADTGHLCVTTLHSNNAHQALVRILNFFPEEAHNSVLLSLSQNLEAILSQKLLPSLGADHILAVEIMLNTGLIKNLIADNRLKDIKDMIERQHDIGMQTFDYSLYELFKAKSISMETALAYAENPSALKLKVAQNDSQSELAKALKQNQKHSSF